MDIDPPSTDVSKKIVALIEQSVDFLRVAWDAMYPSNPVGRRGGDDD